MATTPYPMVSSDGHLEVLSERWSGRMPVKYRKLAPHTTTLPDGSGAIAMEGAAPFKVMIFATDFPPIECDWSETRAYADRMFEGVPWNEAYPILAGNTINFFHLEGTPMAKQVEAQAAAADWR